MEYVIMAGFAISGGGIGYLLGRVRLWAVLIGLIAVVVVVAVWQVFEGMNASSGWDAIAVTIVIFFVLVPFGLGLGVGGGIARWRGGSGS